MRQLFGTKRRIVGAVLAVLTVVGLAACNDKPKPPAAPEPPSDLVFSGVSVNTVVEEFAKTVQLSYSVKYVAAGGDEVKCPDGSGSLKSDAEWMLLCGDQETLIVAEGAGKTLNSVPPVGVWFWVTKELAHSLKGAEKVKPASCVAGFVTWWGMGADFTMEDLVELKGFLLKFNDGNSLHAGSAEGIVLAQKNDSWKWCLTPSYTSGDYITP